MRSSMCIRVVLVLTITHTLSAQSNIDGTVPSKHARSENVGRINLDGTTHYVSVDAATTPRSTALTYSSSRTSYCRTACPTGGMFAQAMWRSQPTRSSTWTMSTTL